MYYLEKKCLELGSQQVKGSVVYDATGQNETAFQLFDT